MKLVIFHENCLCVYYNLSTNAREVQRLLGNAGHGFNELNPRKQRHYLMQAGPVKSLASDLRPLRAIISIAVS